MKRRNFLATLLGAPLIKAVKITPAVQAAQADPMAVPANSGQSMSVEEWVLARNAQITRERVVFDLLKKKSTA